MELRGVGLVCATRESLRRPLRLDTYLLKEIRQHHRNPLHGCAFSSDAPSHRYRQSSSGWLPERAVRHAVHRVNHLGLIDLTPLRTFTRTELIEFQAGLRCPGGAPTWIIVLMLAAVDILAMILWALVPQREA